MAASCPPTAPRIHQPSPHCEWRPHASTQHTPQLLPCPPPSRAILPIRGCPCPPTPRASS
eukprot:3653099-Prymnesium_polylepis.1